MSNPAPKGKQPAPESLLKDADYARVSDLEKSFKFFKRINDPRFGDISIIQNPQNRQFLAVREKKINDRAETGRQILAARQRVNLKSPYLLELKDYSVTKQSELCSTFYILKLFYEYPRSDLRKEIQEKQSNGQPFSHIELTHLFYQQIMAQSTLQAHDQTHGDMQPLHIGWDRETMVSKLIDRYEEPGNQAKTKQIQKNRLIAGHNLYQSPTMYANLKKGNLNFNFDPAKEDAFALGLVMLEAGNGQSVQNIYDKSKGTVDQVVLQKHIDDFNKKFGTDNALLTSSVASLVTFDENSRPTARQIESSIPTYDTVKGFLAGNQTVNIQSGQNGVHTVSETQKTAQDAKKTETEFNMFNFDGNLGSNPYMIENKDFTLFKSNEQNAVQDNAQGQSYNYRQAESIVSAPQVQSNSYRYMDSNVSAPQTTYVQSTPQIQTYSYQQSQVVAPQNTVQHEYQAPKVNESQYSYSYSQPSTVQYDNTGASFHQYAQEYSYSQPTVVHQTERSIQSTPSKPEVSHSYRQVGQFESVTPESVRQVYTTPEYVVPASPQVNTYTYQTSNALPQQTYYSSQRVVAEPTTTYIQSSNVTHTPQVETSHFKKSVRAIPTYEVTQPQTVTYVNNAPSTYRTEYVSSPSYRTEYVTQAPTQSNIKYTTNSYRVIPSESNYVSNYKVEQPLTTTSYVNAPITTVPVVQSEVKQDYVITNSTIGEPRIIRKSYNYGTTTNGATYTTTNGVQNYSSRVVQYAPTEVRRSYRVNPSHPSIQTIHEATPVYTQTTGGNQYIQSNTDRYVVDQSYVAHNSELQGLKMVGSYTDFKTGIDKPNY
jgi:hypothetical protein